MRATALACRRRTPARQRTAEASPSTARRRRDIASSKRSRVALASPTAARSGRASRSASTAVRAPPRCFATTAASVRTRWTPAVPADTHLMHRGPGFGAVKVAVAERCVQAPRHKAHPHESRRSRCRSKCRLRRNTRDRDPPGPCLGPPSGPPRTYLIEWFSERAGFENGEPAPIDVRSQTSAVEGAPKVADGSRNPSDAEPFGPSCGPTYPVERALATALEAASAAGRFDVVAQLARELEARRLAAVGNVVPLERRRGEASVGAKGGTKS
jgi:hypothetical protein